MLIKNYLKKKAFIIALHVFSKRKQQYIEKMLFMPQAELFHQVSDILPYIQN